MPVDSLDVVAFAFLIVLICVLLYVIRQKNKYDQRRLQNEGGDYDEQSLLHYSGVSFITNLANPFIVELTAHQQDDIYNISGRVQNQEQWPTHDAHLSIDHISVLNQMNKPVYDDAPPSYEEVMKTSIQVVGETSTPPYSPPQPPSQVVIVVPPTTRSQ
ncbi:uncharacterized protein LOC114328718 isoform X1 [Diabrotica virgifera virgifera]|uniref:Uncharacterized protein n=1 Tax=Diabrotica virgifera virgifera TaxID=50390 RepID=A0ABM5KB32_DIAVI|nr:uncharacterized protein LOC114328718 isoform X1 [Diabrotica virgifera virgifera]